MDLKVDHQGKIFEKHGGYNIFRQLAVKVFADHIPDEAYYEMAGCNTLRFEQTLPKHRI